MNEIAKYAIRVCQRAFELAEVYGLQASVVAVDKGGHRIVTLRSDRSAFPSEDLARQKATAAAVLEMPTAAAAHMFQNDIVQQAAFSATNTLLVPGGFPLILDGQCVGGLGVCTDHWSNDQMVAENALIDLNEASKAR